MVGIFFALGRIAVVNSEKSVSEKKRADVLQQSVNALRNRSVQDQDFFELVRKLITAQGEAERQALIDQLKQFQFGDGTTTTTTTPTSRSSTTTTTTTTTRPERFVSPPSSTTTSTTTTTSAPRSPPTTSPPFPPLPPFPQPPSTLLGCISVPIRPICT